MLHLEWLISYCDADVGYNTILIAMLSSRKITQHMHELKRLMWMGIREHDHTNTSKYAIVI